MNYIFRIAGIVFPFLSVLFSNCASAQNYTSYFTGDTADVSVNTIPGIVLMGGASENDSAMIWFLEQSGGGDVVVLRASGSNGYNNYMYSQLGVVVNSVQTIVFNQAAASFDHYVIRQLANAEALWFAGGAMFAHAGVVLSATNHPTLQTYGSDLIARAELAWQRAEVSTSNFTQFQEACDDGDIE